MKSTYDKLLNGHYNSNTLAFRASWQNPDNKTTIPYSSKFPWSKNFVIFVN